MSGDAASGAGPEGKLFVDGVKIDAIEVAEVGWQEIGEIADPGDRLFAAAHLWALQESSPVLIEAGEASALVSVALPHALLATKLHAYCSSRRDPDKHGSDALDVYRLAGAVVRSEGEAFRNAPAPVVASLRWAVEQHWQKAPAQMAGRLRRMTPALPVDEDDLRVLAGLLLEALPSEFPHPSPSEGTAGVPPA